MREPDKKGSSAEAWKLPSPRKLATKDQEATLAVWLVQGPFHPIWDKWLVSMIHLRDIPGVRPAEKKPGMTHEIVMVAVHPTADVSVDEPPNSVPLLEPVDQVIQFAAATDEMAQQVFEEVIDLICRGASPDQDYRAAWNQVIPEIAQRMRDNDNHKDYNKKA